MKWNPQGCSKMSGVPGRATLSLLAKPSISLSSQLLQLFSLLFYEDLDPIFSISLKMTQHKAFRKVTDVVEGKSSNWGLSISAELQAPTATFSLLPRSPRNIPMGIRRTVPVSTPGWAETCRYTFQDYLTGSQIWKITHSGSPLYSKDKQPVALKFHFFSSPQHSLSWAVYLCIQSSHIKVNHLTNPLKLDLSLLQKKKIQTLPRGPGRKYHFKSCDVQMCVCVPLHTAPSRPPPTTHSQLSTRLHSVFHSLIKWLRSP